MTIVRKQKLEKETSLQLLDAVRHAGFGTLKHMTHINNLENILEHGLQCHGNRHQKQDISNLAVNNRRTRRDPHFNKPLHDYVPFYFNPRNAMLFKAQSEHKSNIIILGYNHELLLQNGSLITNANAACDDTGYSKDFNYLYSMNWPMVFSDSWCNNGQYNNMKKQKMMAEALIPGQKGIGKHYLRTIFCSNFRMKLYIERNFILGHIKVVCKPSLFF